MKAYKSELAERCTKEQLHEAVHGKKLQTKPQTKPLSGDETHEPDVEDWQPNVRFEDGVYRFDLPNGDEFVIVPKQDEVVYGNAKSYENPCFLQTKLKDSNLKLTFDGETGELKSAEVLK